MTSFPHYFRCGHGRYFRLHLPPNSTIFCLIVCLSIVAFVRHRVDPLLLLNILASAGATLLSPRHRFPTLSVLTLSSISLLRASVTDSTDASVDASQTFSRVIAVAVTIAAVPTVVAAPVSTLPVTAVASTTASVVAIFAPAPPPATSVRRVALTHSFSFISTQGGNNEH